MIVYKVSLVWILILLCGRKKILFENNVFHCQSHNDPQPSTVGFQEFPNHILI